MHILYLIVQPYFTNCCKVLDIFGETRSQRLQKLQNRCARIIMDMGNEVKLCSNCIKFDRIGDTKST